MPAGAVAAVLHRPRPGGITPCRSRLAGEQAPETCAALADAFAGKPAPTGARCQDGAWRLAYIRHSASSASRFGSRSLALRNTTPICCCRR
ncbi:hypothetical protein FW796_11010 [Pseudomonas sp. 910_21]